MATYFPPGGGGGTPSGSAGGDLSGTYPNPGVAKVAGVAVSGTPSAGQVPIASNGTTAAWGDQTGGSGASQVLSWTYGSASNPGEFDAPAPSGSGTLSFNGSVAGTTVNGWDALAVGSVIIIASESGQTVRFEVGAVVGDSGISSSLRFLLTVTSLSNTITSWNTGDVYTVSFIPCTQTAAQVGLGNVTNDAQLKASDLDTDGTLAADSDSKVASQKATKTYADTKVAVGATTILLGPATADGILLKQITGGNLVVKLGDDSVTQFEITPLGIDVPGTNYVRAGVLRVGGAGTETSLGSLATVPRTVNLPDAAGTVLLDSSDVPGAWTIGTGYTANADGGDPAAVIPTAASVATAMAALILALDPVGASNVASVFAYWSNTAEKVKALEADAVDLIAPNN